MGRSGAGVLVLGLVMVGSLAACASGSEPSVAVSGDLSSPPFELGPSTRLWGAGDRLFVLDGRRAAAYDFARHEWRRLPDAPALLNPEVTNIDDMVVVTGSDCEGPCDQDVPAPMGFAALDLARDAGWTTAHADLGSTNPYDAGFHDVGQVGDERILRTRDGLYALGTDLELRSLSQPEAERVARSVPVFPSSPPGPVTPGSAVTTTGGAVVAPIGQGLLAVHSNGSWKTRRVADGTGDGLQYKPPILEIAAVGDRLVVFDAPRAEGETGTLKRVPL